MGEEIVFIRLKCSAGIYLLFVMNSRYLPLMFLFVVIERLLFELRMRGGTEIIPPCSPDGVRQIGAQSSPTAFGVTAGTGPEISVVYEMRSGRSRCLDGVKPFVSQRELKLKS